MADNINSNNNINNNNNEDEGASLEEISSSAETATDVESGTTTMAENKQESLSAAEETALGEFDVVAEASLAQEAAVAAETAAEELFQMAATEKSVEDELHEKKVIEKIVEWELVGGTAAQEEAVPADAPIAASAPQQEATETAAREEEEAQMAAVEQELADTVKETQAIEKAVEQEFSKTAANDEMAADIAAQEEAVETTAKEEAAMEKASGVEIAEKTSEAEEGSKATADEPRCATELSKVANETATTKDETRVVAEEAVEQVATNLVETAIDQEISLAVENAVDQEAKIFAQEEAKSAAEHDTIKKDNAEVAASAAPTTLDAVVIAAEPTSVEVVADNKVAEQAIEEPAITDKSTSEEQATPAVQTDEQGAKVSSLNDVEEASSGQVSTTTFNQQHGTEAAANAGQKSSGDVTIAAEQTSLEEAAKKVAEKAMEEQAITDQPVEKEEATAATQHKTQAATTHTAAVEEAGRVAQDANQDATKVSGENDIAKPKDGLLMLISKQSLDRQVVARQEMAYTIFNGNAIEYVTLDGADPANLQRRSELFAISGIRAKYPQFFMVQDGTTKFWGDWDRFEQANDCGKLMEELVGVKKVAGPAPEKLTNVSAHDCAASTYTGQLLVLISKQSLDRQVVARQENAYTILSGNNIQFVTIDGADPANSKRRSELFAISGIRAKYPQFFTVHEGTTKFWGDWDRFECANDSGTLTDDLIAAGI